MRQRLQAEINVTPLVDVCLVLLIIFMVVTPLLEHSVELPKAEKPLRWPAEPARSKVTIAYGPPVKLSLDDDPGPLSDSAFQELIRALHEQNPRREILLRADRRLSYGEVKRVLGYVQAAGFANVGLVAEKVSLSAEGRVGE
jgi:biopolymer transport protein ExbD